ncbi:MAG: hypothetical protein AMXMBFR16_11590 [Candidatus Uhrbacteria bacterium]
MITREFATAGRAVFTVSNATGERYTFKVKRKDNEAPRPPVYFVSLLTGPDNTRDYTYVGVLNDYNGSVRLTAASRYAEDSKPVAVVRWALKKVWERGTLPAGYEILHEGRCGRCGRPLTVPESIKTGLGPECAGRI